jgi:hypothetical protein
MSGTFPAAKMHDCTGSRSGGDLKHSNGDCRSVTASASDHGTCHIGCCTT